MTNLKGIDMTGVLGLFCRWVIRWLRGSTRCAARQQYIDLLPENWSRVQEAW